ncbi:MAG: succinylglutamate desuccinylase/aspartoacylase family protein [Proteobacteria bacterium]|nr:succinylglutamate desuccinylase/aspartoacylase family protein [Pseudomonadota bacterium]
MIDLRPKLHLRLRLLGVMLIAASAAVGGEVAVGPADNGVDMPGNKTADFASRSEEISAGTERPVDSPKSARAHVVPLADAVPTAVRLAEPLKLLGAELPAGSSQRLSWSATELFEGVPVTTPVLVVNGALPGPTLCLTAAIHGDELNGVEIIRRVMHKLVPGQLSGAIIGIPIVNVQGFRRGSRYLPDRRDLNRYFPGNPTGSAAARIAHSLFTNVIVHCDALVDLHTGSFERANLPQIRADLRNPDVVTLTQGFGAMVILHSSPKVGTLRFAATEAGIPTVTLEAGGPSRLELNEVNHGVKGLETLISTLGIVRQTRLWSNPEPVYYRSTWVRADSGGILLAAVSLGSTVREGDLLGTITDPMSNARSELRSPNSGRVIGMAHNQVVMPGFAAFHIGIETDQTAPDARRDPVAKRLDAISDDYVDGMSE